MTIDQINKILLEKHPDTFIFASFTQRGRELIIAFNFEGGSSEDKVFLVKFKEAVIFHLPSVISYSIGEPIVFELSPSSMAINYIPLINYDEEEFGEKGYKIFLLKTLTGQETGYYIASESVDPEWVPSNDAYEKWGIW